LRKDLCEKLIKNIIASKKSDEDLAVVGLGPEQDAIRKLLKKKIKVIYFIPEFK
jgi:hypothetical protein